MFDDVEAVSESGEVTLIEGFEDSFEWIPLATSELGTEEVEWVSDEVHSGGGAARFTFGKETNVGLRGIYRSAGHGFIPAVASRTFSENTGAGVNNALLVNLPGGVVPVVVTGIVDYFPTLDPARGGFLIFDMDTLLGYMDALNPTGAASVNEIFVRVAPGADAEVFQEMSRMVRARGDAVGLEEQLAAQEIDPLISAGWRTIALVALGVIMFISGLGYVVYLLAFAERSVGEMGSLRSLGFSRVQTIALIGLEHMLIALIGLGVGTWAGIPDEPHDGGVGGGDGQRGARSAAVHPDDELGGDGVAVRGAGGGVRGRAADVRGEGAEYRPAAAVEDGELGGDRSVGGGISLLSWIRAAIASSSASAARATASSSSSPNVVSSGKSGDVTSTLSSSFSSMIG